MSSSTLLRMLEPASASPRINPQTPRSYTVLRMRARARARHYYNVMIPLVVEVVVREKPLTPESAFLIDVDRSLVVREYLESHLHQVAFPRDVQHELGQLGPYSLVLVIVVDDDTELGPVSHRWPFVVRQYGSPDDPPLLRAGRDRREDRRKTVRVQVLRPSLYEVPVEGREGFPAVIAQR